MQARNCLVITLVVCAFAACGGGPSAPTPIPAAPPTTFSGDLSGTWTGTYAVTGCTPMLAPNQCSWYVPLAPETMTLTLAQSGSSLSGTFTSGIIDSLPVTGTVDTAGVVRLSGSRPSQFRCFEASIRAKEVGDWATEVTKGGELRGTFRQSSEQILSSCYTGRYDYFTEVLSFRRAGTAPPAPVLPPADGVRVAGRILDFRTGTPVPNVAVTWHARADTYAVIGDAAARSDSQGQYSVVVPPAAYYALTFDDPSHSGSSVVRLPAGVTQTDILVGPGACNWVRYGTVIDAAARRPMAGVRISATGKSTITRADGSYLLDYGCPGPGIVSNLVALADGYAAGSQFSYNEDAVRGIRRVDFALSPR